MVKDELLCDSWAALEMCTKGRLRGCGDIAFFWRFAGSGWDSCTSLHSSLCCSCFSAKWAKFTKFCIISQARSAGMPWAFPLLMGVKPVILTDNPRTERTNAHEMIVFNKKRGTEQVAGRHWEVRCPVFSFACGPHYWRAPEMFLRLLVQQSGHCCDGELRIAMICLHMWPPLFLSPSIYVHAIEVMLDMFNFLFRKAISLAGGLYYFHI